ncbi:Mechanosensitive ion channel protein [Klebsormidium nitens]|uniref:Mechanosensitive ion channel protein n=1 Tax=Klebsormidium nitens TaxID=105231 RepID=A0A1Y1HTD2_KLENI|nr:Mechanosensitive ion channel protein [Klebsormidium nitens]|eukprot:GAQ81880.1 Mechanosensitive ion channel protein [Klebsormidium nitens]
MEAIAEKVAEKVAGRSWFDALLEEGVLCATLYLVYVQGTTLLRLAHGVYQKAEDQVESKVQSFQEPGKKRDVTANNVPFEHSMFGAADWPLKALVAFLILSHFASTFFFPTYFATEQLWLARRAAIVLCGLWFGFRWKSNYTRLLIRHNPHDRDRYIVLDKVATIGLVTVAALSLGEVIGVAFQSLLAIGGVSGIAAGLAAKDLLGNLFSGALMYVTRPFKIGEFISAGPATGKVLDIGFYNTKMLTVDRAITYVPNSSFTCSTITNFSRQETRYIEGTFLVRHRDISAVDAITADLRELLRAHPAVDTQEQPPRAFLAKVGPLGAEIAMNAVTKPIGFDDYLVAKQTLLVKAAKIIESHGAVIGPALPPNWQQ